MEINIQKNFSRIYSALLNKGTKRTAFAKGMGFSSTSQLAATLDGESLISTKAVIQLIQNFNINPTFLFTGNGEMFLAEKEEIDELKEHITFIEKQKDDLAKSALKLGQMVETLERRNGDLIDMWALAMKNHKEEEEEKEVKINKTSETKSSLNTE